MKHCHSLPGWDPGFADTSPLFAPLRHLAQRFRHFEQWPGLADYQALLDDQPRPVRTRAGTPLRIVAQEPRPTHFDDHYAPRIHQRGELQTRRENWHDMFQLLSWLMFPDTKAAINAAHLDPARRRLAQDDERGRRSPLENMLSLFDEGGAVILSSDAELLALIRDFRWKELFWQRRGELAHKLACIPFGHALYEKGLAPYVGMTAHTVLMQAPADFFAQATTEQLCWLDAKLAPLFDAGVLTQAQDLQPFPILGMPGWDPANNQAAYYDNSDYFRPGRRARGQAVMVACA